MLRTLLVGILAVTAAAACSGKGDAPAAQPGVSAGKVVELSGTVTATRGTVVRTLAAGGEISSDDVIDTAAESRVVILVAHNNARWDLGPNKHGKVAESLAWTAAKQDRPATAVIEESSTAGAHAEKTAATTGTTTPETPKAAMAVASTEKTARAAPAADELQTKGDPAPGAALPTTPPPTGGTPPPPSPSRRKLATPAAQATQLRQDKEDDARSTTEGVKVEKKAETASKAGRSVQGAGPGAAMDSIADVERGGKGSAGDPVRQQILEGIRKQFATGRTEMRACFEPNVPTVRVRLAVTDGVYTIAIIDPAATPKARACLAKIAKDLGTTTKHDQPVSLTLTLEKP